MSSAVADTPRIALVGQPNCGKTSLFNLLTGARQKVANYAGVTVERKAGQFQTPRGRTVHILDLPGTYALEPRSPDEAVTAQVLRGEMAGESRPDLIVCVLDATQLRRHLRFALRVRRMGLPMVVSLNMSDLARRRGLSVDTARLAAELGVPVVESVAVRGNGARALAGAIDAHCEQGTSAPATARPEAGRRHGRGRPDPAGARHRPDRSRPHERGDRSHRAASARGPARAGGRDVPRVPGGVRVVAAADGVDPGRRRGASGRARRRDSRIRAEEPAARRRARGRRQRAGVPAADPDPVPLHPPARGFGLPAARGLPARPVDGQRRPVGSLVHPAAVELRVRRARDHGHAHDSESARPLDHDHDRAADDVFGAPAGVRAADRRVHSGAARRSGHPAAGPRAVRAVRRRDRRGVPRVLRADPLDARAGRAVADGAARVPLAERASSRARTARARARCSCAVSARRSSL